MINLEFMKFFCSSNFLQLFLRRAGRDVLMLNVEVKADYEVLDTPVFYPCESQEQLCSPERDGGGTAKYLQWNQLVSI